MKGKRTLATRLRALFTGGSAPADLIDELEELLLEADLGPRLVTRVIELIEARATRGTSREELLELVADTIGQSLRYASVEPQAGVLNVYLLLGVNGVGKTTSLAKLAARFRDAHEVLVVAADTFRAAAAEQLEVWAERLKVPVVRQSAGADPGAVVYDGIEAAKARGADVVLVDTAGRLHTKEHLVRELGKIERIVQSRAPADARIHRLLVVDATTGQNALRQAEVFAEAVGVDAVIVAKLDGSAGGGVCVAISEQLGLPFCFVGTGEGIDDLEPFDPGRFVGRLVGR